MNTGRWLRTTLAALSALAAVGAWAAREAAAHGEFSALSGAYGFTLAQTCVRGPLEPPPAVQFDPATGRLLVEGEVVNASGTGVMRFARGGGVRVEDGVLTELSSAQTAPGQTPVSAGTRFSCEGSYARGADRKLELSVVCEVAARPGVTVRVGPLEFEGFAVNHRGAIELAGVSGNIHKVSIAVNGTVVQERERVCVQNMVLGRL